MSHCLMWDRDGKLYSWGDATDGKLGHGMINGKYNYTVNDPMHIKSLESHKIITGSCGHRHSCCLSFKGEIYSFGRQHYDKSTDNVNLDYVRPNKLNAYYKSLKFSNQLSAFFVQISSYGYHNIAID